MRTPRERLQDENGASRSDLRWGIRKERRETRLSGLLNAGTRRERVRERTAALHLGESELSDVATQRCLRCWNPLRLQGGNKFALCPDWAPRDDVA